MKSEENAEGKKQQPAPQGYYAHIWREGGPALFISSREREQTEHQCGNPRWYHQVGGWVCRVPWAFGGWLGSSATVIIMVATVVNASVAYYQWKVAQEGVTASRESADAATRAANAADATRKSIEDNSHLDQRAWLTVREINRLSPLRANTFMVNKVIIGNSGKSPALRVHGQASMGYKDGPPTAVGPCGHVGELQSVGVLGPSSVTTFSPKLSAYPQDFVDSVTSHKITIYVCGEIDYEDIFQQPRLTTFCGFYEPDDDTFIWCEEGNNAK